MFILYALVSIRVSQLSSVYILGQVILCYCGHLLHCRMFSKRPGLCLPDATMLEGNADSKSSWSVLFFQVPWLQGGPAGPWAARHCLCGVWQWGSGRGSSWRPTGLQDHPEQCHEDLFCQEVAPFPHACPLPPIWDLPSSPGLGPLKVSPPLGPSWSRMCEWVFTQHCTQSLSPDIAPGTVRLELKCFLDVWKKKKECPIHLFIE